MHPATENRPCLAITLGDPNGIGPEIVLKCLRDADLMASTRPVLIGSEAVLRHHADVLGTTVDLYAVEGRPPGTDEGGLAVIDVTDGATPSVELGATTAVGGALAMKAVEAATDACIEGWADAMVTAPLSKQAIAEAGYDFPGHTEYIAERTGAPSHAMMMVADDLRVGLVTGHLPVSAIAPHITQTAILEKLRVMARSVRTDFGVETPQLAVLGLNPHAGDGGVLGREEIETIRPALEAARAEGLHVAGPFSADGYFATERARYDAVLAMYHDQGLVPFKALAFDRGVNFTAGLPIVRTSPDHGTAFNIAGQGIANPGSMRSAIELATEVAQRRAAQSAQAAL